MLHGYVDHIDPTESEKDSKEEPIPVNSELWSEHRNMTNFLVNNIGQWAVNDLPQK